MTNSTPSVNSGPSVQEAVALLAVLHDRIEYEKNIRLSKNKQEINALLNMNLTPEMISYVCSQPSHRLEWEDQETFRRRRNYQNVVTKHRVRLMSHKGTLPKDRSDRLIALTELINAKRISTDLATKAYNYIMQDRACGYSLNDDHTVKDVVPE